MANYKGIPFEVGQRWRIVKSGVIVRITHYVFPDISDEKLKKGSAFAVQEGNKLSTILSCFSKLEYLQLKQIQQGDIRLILENNNE